MSRVSKNPITIPASVEISILPSNVLVKGPLGTLQQALTNDVMLEINQSTLKVQTTNDSKHANALSGTIRALIANMIQGVSIGFEKKLQLVGVGYRAQAGLNRVNLTLGFSHPVDHVVPDGITIETPSQTEIIIKGIDKQKVGQTAADIRAYRKPEPYKGKGVRYSDEVIVLKETKKK
ncbi:MAG: 50S ribosomal protein L6 [Nitrosomonas sp.]|uniref:50S ribosomal protein L6 n=1 Tax=Nitrosomonas sp. TaxID=42353 RepID=UPI002731AAF8|nr:50S ribosomal protein L6 [Nitrosomonas sp.]MDP1787321.1 50S ribosomal protein L6 [Nitrosomonas sp.]MDP2223817.1 50S ribosomal protein L6 [Nitrosomonas sp.]MDP3662593.1 50S ribosomal protein L6 [Nitrosomonas sp.]MDZ4104578.1 50S ribosomal protein L6 [Nitrosomonas sp.]